MRQLIHLTLTTSLMALAGCASIIQGSSQNVQISTTPPSQASCTVANKVGSWNALPSSLVMVKKSKTDLMVNCVDRSSGYAGTKSVESEMEPWFLGNILFGGIIGAPIDFATGAAWDYPKDINVALKPSYQPAGYSVPIAPSAGYAAPAPNGGYAAPAPAGQPQTISPLPTTPSQYQAPQPYPAAR